MDLRRKDGRRRVVVTGGGIVNPIGRDWKTIFENLKQQKNFTAYNTDWDVFERMNTRLACAYTQPLSQYPRKKIRGMGRVAVMSLMSAEDALKMAGLQSEDGAQVSPLLQNGRTGIAYGACMGSFPAVVDLCRMDINGDMSRIDSQTYIKAMPQTCAANLSVYYQIRGRIITTNTACTSGSQAVGYAYEAIAGGMQDIMLAGGAEELCSPSAAVFDTMGAAAWDNDRPETEPRPFDQSRNGLVLGEGAGTLVLESLESALNRGAKIYAEVAGFGTNADGTHVTNPNRETMAEALRMAISDAAISATDIGYVNAHGTATTTGDIAETNATFSVFARAVPISSTKSYIGHTLGACGAIEAWISLNMMNEGWFHPTLNLSHVDERCAPLDYIAGSGREISTEYVMSNNFAFGGMNTSLIFKKFTA